MQCLESRVQRCAMPKSTESRADEHAERFVIDVTGSFHVTSLGGNRYAMLCVDDFTRFKFILFFRHKRDAAKELRELVAEQKSLRRHQDRHCPHRWWRRVRRRIPFAPEGNRDQARDDPSAYGSIQRLRGAGAWTPTRQDRGPSTRYDRRQERPPLGGSHGLRLRNVEPLHDNLPSTLVSPHTNSGSDTGSRSINLFRLEPSDTFGDPNPSTSWRHAWPSASCSASTLTTRDKPFASATSPPAKSSCVRPSYGTPQLLGRRGQVRRS